MMIDRNCPCLKCEFKRTTERWKAEQPEELAEFVAACPNESEDVVFHTLIAVAASWVSGEAISHLPAELKGNAAINAATAFKEAARTASPDTIGPVAGYC